MALREARSQTILCPECQLKSGYPPFHLRQSRYRSGNRTAAHLYTVPVLNDLDNIRNSRAWHQAREGVRALRQEARHLAREVTELEGATGGCTATIHQFLDGSVGYFAPDAPMWREAGEITGPDLAKALEILQQLDLPGGKTANPHAERKPNRHELGVGPNGPGSRILSQSRQGLNLKPMYC